MSKNPSSEPLPAPVETKTAQTAPAALSAAKFRPLLIGLVAFTVIGSGYWIWQDQAAKSARAEKVAYFEARRDSTATESDKVVEKSLALLETYRGSELSLTAMWDHALTLRDACFGERDPQKRLTRLQELQKHLDAMTPDVEATPASRLPARATGEAFATAFAKIKGTVSDELKWLQTEAATAKLLDKPDDGFSATVTLVDAEGVELSLTLEFFSGLAPIAVHNFVAMASSGRWTGTQTIAALGQDQGETFTTNGIVLGSWFSRIAPEKPEVWGKDDDFVGFTLPIEKTGLEPKRGSVGFAPRRESNLLVGLDPLILIIQVGDERPDPDFQPFAQIKMNSEAAGGTDILGALLDKLPIAAAKEGSEAAPRRELSNRLKVKGIQLTGSADVAPSRDLLGKFVEPTVPE